ncbi:MAG: phage holin family protein [Clostridiales bacterium]|nr:phage holin family protein [Clostridiales bacterium]
MAREIREENGGILSTLLKFVINAVVLLAVSFLVPGFVVVGFWTAFLAAIVITLLDYLASAVFKLDASPFGRGLSGFVIAAIIIYATQYLVAGVAVTFMGAIIAALVIGLFDAIIPTNVF